jgi:hypothetical protein
VIKPFNTLSAIFLAINAVMLTASSHDHFYINFPPIKGNAKSVMTRIRFQCASISMDVPASKIKKYLCDMQLDPNKYVVVTDSQLTCNAANIQNYISWIEQEKKSFEDFMKVEANASITFFAAFFQGNYGANFRAWMANPADSQENVVHTLLSYLTLYNLPIEQQIQNAEEHLRFCDHYKDQPGFVEFNSFVRSKVVPSTLLQEYFTRVERVMGIEQKALEEYGLSSLSQELINGKINQLFIMRKTSYQQLRELYAKEKLTDEEKSSFLALKQDFPAYCDILDRRVPL